MLQPVDANSTAQKVNAGELTAKGSVEAALARAESLQATSNAFITLLDGATVEAAQLQGRLERAPTELPLAGVPVVVQDDLAVAGALTTAGSALLKEFTPSYDQETVRLLRAAGAVPIGKANVSEFGLEWSARSSAYGPVSLPDSEGEQANGAALAVAAGVTPLALASDAGGEARHAASHARVIGFKPSRGALPLGGLISYASSLAEVAIVATSVADVALVLRSARGEPAVTALQEPLDLTVGVVTSAREPDENEGVRAAAKALRGAGVKLTPAELKSAPHAHSAHRVLAAAEAASNLARYTGMLLGERALPNHEGQEAVMAATRGALFGELAKEWILFGTLVLMSGERENYYSPAVNVRRWVKRELAEQLGSARFLLLPPTEGWALVVANLAGLPAVTLPVDGSGAQLVGPPGSDAELLALAGYLTRLVG